MITYIRRNLLEPHPDNPRKELGDLSELAASIRRQGLLQNLTVVPSPTNAGKYRIVIGHRRFSASGIVGIDELPCVIDESMSYADQIAVMMAENMQRNDLSVTERVGGVQMMMDLGMDAAEVSSKTGLGESTVRRYAKLAKIERPDLAAAERKGATLMQLAEIAAIEEEDLRTKALNEVGGANFEFTMRNVRYQQAARKNEPLATAALKEFAEAVDRSPEYALATYENMFRFGEDNVVDKIKAYPRDKGAEYCFVIQGSCATLYRRKKADPNAKEKARAEEERQERLKRMSENEKELAREFWDRRRAFMESLNTKGREDDILRFALWVLGRSAYLQSVMIGGVFAKTFPLERGDKPSYTASLDLSTDEVEEIPARQLFRALALAAYDRIDTGDCLLDSRTGKHNSNAGKMLDLYEMMECMGYVPGDDEYRWLEGRHECYTFPEE